MKKENKFLVMWDNQGLETLINITDMEQQAIVSALKGEEIRYSNPIQHMILRARFNQQRHYEIYVFTSEISEVSIREFFADSPQIIVNAIRECGHQLYSDRIANQNVVIT